jgi:hypothetical protein
VDFVFDYNLERAKGNLLVTNFLATQQLTK